MKFGGEDPSKKLTTVCITKATSNFTQNETAGDKTFDLNQR